jgi:hypothetical protein
MKAIEKYYSVAELSVLLSICPRTVKRRLKAGEFGQAVVNLGTSVEQADYRIPASGVNAYLERHQMPVPQLGIAARSIGELRRKAAA